jgi:hypothetical protein
MATDSGKIPYAFFNLDRSLSWYFQWAHGIRIPDLELNARYSTLKSPECKHGTSPVYVNIIQK